MNGWLGQVSLRSAQPGLRLVNRPSEPSQFLGQAALQPVYELGKPVRRHNLGQLACCNAPTGKSYCFDTGSGECIMTWVSSATGSPDTPACVQDSRGQWVLPSCLGLEAQPSPGRPELPAGCSYVAAEGNAMQEVICETYNCTTRESGGWRGMLSDFLSMGGINPGLKSPEWFPKPAQCPNGPGGGGTYTPPGAAAPPAPAPTMAPAPGPLPMTPQQGLAPVSYDTSVSQGEQAIPAPPTSTPIPVSNMGPAQVPQIPVLPAPQKMTYESPPTGAWPGQPFPAAPRSAPVPMAKAPAPIPEACPLGPVPIRRWVEDCMGA